MLLSNIIILSNKLFGFTNWKKNAIFVINTTFLYRFNPYIISQLFMARQCCRNNTLLYCDLV